MLQGIQVRPLHEWAILPAKYQVDRNRARQEAQLLTTHFRYQRSVRYAEACPPWVMGQELGWVIPSPVNVTMTPLDDLQIAVDGDEELREAGRLFGRDEFWRRGDGYIATRRNDWLRTHQYRGAHGGWEGMFIPNGQGSVEWRLGWSIRIPDDHFLLVTGLDDDRGITVPTGVLTARQADRTWDEHGFSVAVRPDRAVGLARGEPIARIVLLGRESLQAKLEEVADGDSR